MGLILVDQLLSGEPADLFSELPELTKEIQFLLVEFLCHSDHPCIAMSCWYSQSL